jgi:glycosyltransferase involved in cell wall biosynthesis
MLTIPKAKALSLFYPCYNEADTIFNLVTKSIPIIDSLAQKWEIILINDGSTDQTARVLCDLRVKFGPRIKIITHSHNRGYGAALKSGFYQAIYPWIAFTDADGQFDLKDIFRLIKKQRQTQADLVIGYYLRRQVPRYRRLGTVVWQFLVFLFFGLRVRDIDCAFKLISRRVIDTIPRLQAERGPFISSELLIKAKKAGFKVEEVSVHHYPRLAGQATGTNLNVILSALKDLIRLRFII